MASRQAGACILDSYMMDNSGNGLTTGILQLRCWLKNAYLDPGSKQAKWRPISAVLSSECESYTRVWP